MSAINIRTAVLFDLDCITQHNINMAKETEDKHLDLETARLGAQAVLEDNSKGFYLLAEKDNRIVGQLQVTYEWSDWRNANFWWIQSVYVKPEFRRQGVYKYLHQYLVEQARRTPQVCGLRLYTSKDNLSAQATYMSLGMKSSHYDLYEIDFTG
jgi:ribosomal protein S18 acetylase RimI-like enzyme